MARFQGKVCLVTGAGSGIGQATALAFAREGGQVVVSDRKPAMSEATVTDILNAGGNAIAVACDVSKEAEVRHLVETTLGEYGRLDVAFNNAGIEGSQAPLADQAPADWQRVLDVNLNGVFYGMKHEIPAMLASKGGAIVNNASILGLVGFPGASAYVASKHAILGITKTAALEYARQGIRVNAVCPGFVRTAMVDRYTTSHPGAEHEIAAAEPVGRMGTSQEIAAAVLYLSSDEASFTTGLSMTVDGGWTAQ